MNADDLEARIRKLDEEAKEKVRGVTSALTGSGTESGIAPRRRRRVVAMAVLAAIVAVVAAVVVIRVTRNSAVPVGTTATLGDWTIRVDSVDWNAGNADAHAQFVRITMTVGYHGGGEQDFPYGGSGPGDLYVEGDHKFPYSPAGCENRYDIADVLNVFSGDSQKAEACFEVARNDVPTLEMYAGTLTLASITSLLKSPNSTPPAQNLTKFALR